MKIMLKVTTFAVAITIMLLIAMAMNVASVEPPANVKLNHSEEHGVVANPSETISSPCSVTRSLWDIETVDSDGNVGADTSIALDTNGYPHISYYDETNGNLKYAKWRGGSGGSGSGAADEAAPEGKIVVTVRDAADKKLLDAHISVCDSSGAEQWDADNGRINHKFLVSGSPYSFEVSEDGYKTVKETGISLTKDKTETFDIYLETGSGVVGEVILAILKPYYIGEGIKKEIDYAKVYIDDEYKDKFTGHIFKLELSVDIGIHTITLKAGGFNDKNITLNIRADNVLDSQEMTRRKPEAATKVDPSTYPKEFNIGYVQQCPITIVNASDFDETFIVSQIFEGIDVIYTMVFESEWIYLRAGKEDTVDVPVTIPIEAIPIGMDVATYEIKTRLEVD